MGRRRKHSQRRLLARLIEAQQRDTTCDSRHSVYGVDRKLINPDRLEKNFKKRFDGYKGLYDNMVVSYLAYKSIKKLWSGMVYPQGRPLLSMLSSSQYPTTFILR